MEVNNLDFLDELSQNKTALPDELPRPVHREKLPAELLRSTTIENLISQNEDLMARLKVTLRRLAILETENQKLIQEAQKERTGASAAMDQLLVLKEKDQLWKQKIDDLEKAKAILQDKLVNLQNIYNKNKTQLERHEKYQERIRSHVKPFVQELKKYSKSLEGKLQEALEQVSKREAQLSDLRHQVVELTKNSKYQVETLERKNWEMTEHYETVISQLNQESESLKKLNSELVEKVNRLKYFQERADHMENENIELRRRIDNLVERHHFEQASQQEQIQEQSRENARLKVEHEDIQARLLEELETRKNLEKQVFDLRHQLDSLRFMWTAKNDENEKLRQSLQALEKLNVDLSSKLQEIRSSEDKAAPEAGSETPVVG